MSGTLSAYVERAGGRCVTVCPFELELTMSPQEAHLVERQGVLNWAYCVPVREQMFDAGGEHQRE